ncbi:YwqH-like family protein [Numidum massiliense]|uniref:YwqH-like family protein n=1 Tax=Numidum massiliense TaxID=1522315 RepID=UPI0006D55718|nr:DUF5082 family protein [Numidum massiliense]
MLDPSVDSLNASVKLKEEQLARLKTCHAKLKMTQQEFIRYKNWCTHPSLSSYTWQGSLAEQFDQMRESNIVRSYEDIADRQLKNVMQMVLNRTTQLEEEIVSLKESILSLEAQSRSK